MVSDIETLLSKYEMVYLASAQSYPLLATGRPPPLAPPFILAC